ncbi:MAG: patatin-like phospholipase family protein [Rhizobiaceae bacterium]
MSDVALVLGGGGARGLSHVHVLEAFDDLGVRPAVIAGSSIGSIMGAAYAAGMSGAEIRNYMVDVLGDRAAVASRLIKLRPDSLRSIIDSFPRFGELNAEKVLRAFLPQAIPDRFDQLEIPLRVTATDFFGNALTVIDSGDLYPAMAASAAIPAVFRPVMINGRVHVDGGIASPVPIELVDGENRLVVAVDVVGMPEGNPSVIPGRIAAAFGASQLLMQSVIDMKLKLHQPDLLIRPAVNEFRVLDFLQAEKIIERTRPTRAETRTRLEQLLLAV